MLLVLFGLLDLGRAVYIYNTLANAARQGARVAAVNQSTTNGNCDPQDQDRWSIIDCVQLAGISLNIRPQDISDICYYDAASLTDCDGTETVGEACTDREVTSTCIARVTVDYQYVPLTPIIGDIVGNIDLSSTSEMPVERWFNANP